MVRPRSVVLLLAIHVPLTGRVGCVLVHRELEFLPLGVSESGRTSCQNNRGILPRRFSAWMPIPEPLKGEQGLPRRLRGLLAAQPRLFQLALALQRRSV